MTAEASPGLAAPTASCERRGNTTSGACLLPPWSQTKIWQNELRRISQPGKDTYASPSCFYWLSKGRDTQGPLTRPELKALIQGFMWWDPDAGAATPGIQVHMFGGAVRMAVVSRTLWTSAGWFWDSECVWVDYKQSWEISHGPTKQGNPTLPASFVH